PASYSLWVPFMVPPFPLEPYPADLAGESQYPSRPFWRSLDPRLPDGEGSPPGRSYDGLGARPAGSSRLAQAGAGGWFGEPGRSGRGGEGGIPFSRLGSNALSPHRALAHALATALLGLA